VLTLIGAISAILSVPTGFSRSRSQARAGWNLQTAGGFFARVKPFSEACERNQEPILEQLRDLFAPCRSVLEIGSGTGQHAVFVGGQLPHLIWQTSDLLENHAGIRTWVAEANLENVKPPVLLDVTDEPWPVTYADAVFSANTIHIVSMSAVRSMIAGIGRVLGSGGMFCSYGPYIYDGKHTSDSNVRFDGWLKQRDARSGVRDISDLRRLADAAGMDLEDDREMPANNRLLVWRKR
jgi:hypothetical protein